MINDTLHLGLPRAGRDVLDLGAPVRVAGHPGRRQRRPAACSAGTAGLGGRALEDIGETGKTRSHAPQLTDARIRGRDTAVQPGTNRSRSGRRVRTGARAQRHRGGSARLALAVQRSPATHAQRSADRRARRAARATRGAVGGCRRGRRSAVLRLSWRQAAGSGQHRRLGVRRTGHGHVARNRDRRQPSAGATTASAAATVAAPAWRWNSADPAARRARRVSSPAPKPERFQRILRYLAVTFQQVLGRLPPREYPQVSATARPRPVDDTADRARQVRHSRGAANPRRHATAGPPCWSPATPAARRDFLPILEPLAAAGRTVVAVDLRGQYQSPHGRRPVRLRAGCARR